MLSCAHSILAIAAFGLASLPLAAAAEERRYDVADFNEVSVATGIKAEIEVGPDFSVIASSSAKGLERLDVEVRNGDLRLRRSTRGMNWGRRDGVKVTITMPSLIGLDASSGAFISARNIDADAFELDASSGSRIEVRGQCGALDVDVSSGASIDAGGLVCATVRADASSGARAAVFAGERLSAEASSGGFVKASGDPATVRQDTSSGGRVALN